MNPFLIFFAVLGLLTAFYSFYKLAMITYHKTMDDLLYSHTHKSRAEIGGRMRRVKP